METTELEPRKDLHDRLQELMRLKAGWHPDEPSEPVSEPAHRVATMLVDLLQTREDAPRVRLYPTLEGGLQFEWGTFPLHTLEISPHETIDYLEVSTIENKVRQHKTFKAVEHETIIEILFGGR
jgi:hypothetical protein